MPNGDLRVCMPTTIGEWIDLDSVLASYDALLTYPLPRAVKEELRAILKPELPLSSLLEQRVIFVTQPEEADLTPVETILRGLLLGHPLEATSSDLTDNDPLLGMPSGRAEGILYALSPEVSWTYEGERCGVYYDPTTTTAYILNKDLILDAIPLHTPLVRADDGTYAASTLPFTSPLVSWRNYLCKYPIVAPTGTVLNGIYDPSSIERVLQNKKPISLQVLSMGVCISLLTAMRKSTTTTYIHGACDATGTYAIKIAQSAAAGDLFDSEALLDAYEELLPIRFTDETRELLYDALEDTPVYLVQLEPISSPIVKAIVSDILLGYPLEVTAREVDRLMRVEYEASTSDGKYLV
jgi:hypothetical protein